MAGGQNERAVVCLINPVLHAGNEQGSAVDVGRSLAELVQDQQRRTGRFSQHGRYLVKKCCN